jgi:ABC-2 type transport system permease protein
MRISKAWIVAVKDIRVALRRRYTITSLFMLPLILVVGLPLIEGRIAAAGGPRLENVLNAFSFWFAILGAIIPVSLATYSLVGEKIERSLEPLLATPITDGELLLGKTISSLIPPIAVLYVGSIVFMGLSDLATRSALGFLFFPNWTIGLVLLLVTPLAAILSIEVSVIISARANDVRAAQTQGTALAIPFGVIYVGVEVGAVALTVATVLVIAAILLVVDGALFLVSTRVFQREKILTEWT